MASILPAVVGAATAIGGAVTAGATAAIVGAAIADKYAAAVQGSSPLQNVNNYEQYSIYDSVRRRVIPLTFVPPEEQYSIATNFDYQQLTGRGGQVASYGGTDSMVITFTFDAVQGYLPIGYKDIDYYINDIAALAHKNLEGKSPQCQLRMGKNVFDGYVNSVSIIKKGPYDALSRRLFATITIQFTQKDEKDRRMENSPLQYNRVQWA